MKLQGKIAVIIGGAGSIGRAVALRLAREGATAGIADLRGEQVETAVREVKQQGGEAFAAMVDVRSTADVGRLVQEVTERHGRIDLLVYAAGGSARSKNALLHLAEEEIVDGILDVNLRGNLYAARAVIPTMIAQGGGKIISIASIVGINGKAKLADYAAAKAGVIALTRTLALELGPHGINVNCVSPGIVPREGEKQNLDYVRRTNVLGRVGSPEDIAHMVHFLASDEADFITGQNFIVDGGRSLGLRGD